MDAGGNDRIAGTRTTCPYCGVGCGVVVKPDGIIVGDADHPANFGRLCSKGAALAETLIDSGRLLHPQIDGRRATWGEALNTIAVQFGHTIREHGPEAVAFYVSGQFLTEDYYVANKLMKGFIGSANIDTNSRLCMASSVAGHVRAFGEDIVPGCYEDLEQCDLAILVGSNMAWCHPILYQRLVAAREARGTRIVVIDPRRTPTCDIADLHLAIRPGTDVALFAGLLCEIAERRAADEAWTKHHTVNYAAAVRAARQTAPTLDAVAAICDVPIEAVRTFCDWFIATERVVTLYSQGVNQSSAGTDKVNAIVNCHLAMGRIGRPGMGPFSLTGQPNAMGGREVGGLANQFAAHIGFDDPAGIDRVRRFWQAPAITTRPGLKAVDLFDAVGAGRIKALWIMGTNPAASMPRAGHVREALATCSFVVVSDCWPTDTTRFADIVLPAAGWGEKDGTVTNSERRISRQRAFRPAPGEARPDWWMLAAVAKRMGWRAAFDYPDAAAIFREHAALSAFENDGARLFDLGALAELSRQNYDALAPVQWGARRFFGNGVFPTEDGKARFVPTPYRPIASSPSPQRPLLLNTGRVRDQWHTMTRTGRVARLMNHTQEPLLTINPDDATALHLREGDLARIESDHGSTVLRAAVSPDMRHGEVFVPMHWTDSHASSGPVDRLIGGAVDSVSGQPELKSTPVSVTKLPLLWRGFLLHRNAARPCGNKFYWSRLPLECGEACELAGWSHLPEGAESETWVRNLLGAPTDTEPVIYADPRHGVFRYASLVEGRLEACLFIARAADALPSRDTLIAMLGATIADESRAYLLAGAAAAPVGQAVGGPILCACFRVGVGTLQQAIREQDLTSVEAIGRALRAGTNCGSCIPEMKRVLRAARTGVALVE
jgi:assimilatory nitrate reductase catalytic subunit